jgi:uncharacterized membrane protein YdfJ with MMPL/SSD domain
LETRFYRWKARRPWAVLGFSLVITLVMALFASRLELRTRFDQLLPDAQPSVVELRRITERTDASSNVFIVLEGEELRAFGDALVPRLRGIGRPWVVTADDGIQEGRRFLLPRAGLFAKKEDLEKLRDDIQAR